MRIKLRVKPPRHAPAAGIDGIEQQRRLAAEIGWPDRVSCFGYDPTSVRVEPGPDRSWVIMVENLKLAQADTRANADAVVHIARTHKAKCMIGLGARAPDNRRRVFVFWERGVAPTLRGEYCRRYDPIQLQIRDEGAIGWALIAGDQRLHILNNDADARVALAYARKHSALCSIGLNSRPTPPRTLFTTGSAEPAAPATG